MQDAPDRQGCADGGVVEVGPGRENERDFGWGGLMSLSARKEKQRNPRRARKLRIAMYTMLLNFEQFLVINSSKYSPLSSQTILQP